MDAGLARQVERVLGQRVEVDAAFAAYRGPRLGSGGALMPVITALVVSPLLVWNVIAAIAAAIIGIVLADPVVTRFRRWFVVAVLADGDVVVLDAGRGALGAATSEVERHRRRDIGPLLHEVDREVYIGGRNYWVPDEYVDAARAARLGSKPA